jgi:hypothetical protein
LVTTSRSFILGSTGLDDLFHVSITVIKSKKSKKDIMANPDEIDLDLRSGGKDFASPSEFGGR